MTKRKGKSPRRHHYVPTSYLRGFTPSEGKSGSLWAHDYANKASFEAHPSSLGCTKDLYRFRSNPENSMDVDIEHALARVDADGARVISGLESAVGLPGLDGAGHQASGNELVILLHYACIMHLRNPSLRRSIARLAGSQATMEARLTAWSVANVEEFEQQLADAGVDVPEGEGAKLLEWARSPQFRLEIDDGDWLLLESFSAETEVLRLLTERSWTLWVAAKTAGHFVTSDRPMVLLWKSQHPAGVTPGFAHRDTHVFFPLTKHLLLYGAYDAENSLIEADGKQIAVANSVMVNTCDRFVFGAEPTFPDNRGGEIVDSPGDQFSREPMW